VGETSHIIILCVVVPNLKIARKNEVLRAAKLHHPILRNFVNIPHQLFIKMFYVFFFNTSSNRRAHNIRLFTAAIRNKLECLPLHVTSTLV
jgi:hypothetical protein